MPLAGWPALQGRFDSDEMQHSFEEAVINQPLRLIPIDIGPAEAGGPAPSRSSVSLPVFTVVSVVNARSELQRPGSR